MQSRRQSAAEVITSTSIGMVGSWLITYGTFTLIQDRGLAATVTVAGCTVAGCTVWSLVRGYFVRRRFARMEKS